MLIQFGQALGNYPYDIFVAKFDFSLAFGLLEPVPGGVLLRTGADDLGWFARQLAALPFGFEIHAPAVLRTELARCATRLLGLARASRH